MITRERIQCCYPDTPFMFLDHPAFDKAIMGVMLPDCNRVVYNKDRGVRALVQSNPRWTYETALEWFDYNILPAYVGENTPVFVDTEIL